MASVLSVSPLSLSVSAPCSYLSVFLCVVMRFKWQDHISVHAVNSLPLIFVPSSKLSLLGGGGRKAYASRDKIKLFWKSVFILLLFFC